MLHSLYWGDCGSYLCLQCDIFKINLRNEPSHFGEWVYLVVNGWGLSSQCNELIWMDLWRGSQSSTKWVTVVIGLNCGYLFWGVRYIVETYAIANSSKCRNLRFAFLSIGFLGDTEESVLALHYMVIEDIISTWIFNVIYEGILSPWECIYAHMLATQQRGCQWWIIAFRLSIQVAKSQLLMDCILSHKMWVWFKEACMPITIRRACSLLRHEGASDVAVAH